MTGFYIGTLVMVLVGLMILIRGMLKDMKLHTSTKDETALQIYKEQLEELNRDEAAGVLTAEQHQAAVREMERSLLAANTRDDSAMENNSGSEKDSSYITIILVSLLVPLIAIPLYFYTGQPDLIPTIESIAAQQENGESTQGPTMEAMLEILAQRLDENPNDVQGLMLLGRSYLSIGKIAESVTTFEKLYQITGDDPTVLLSYAEALIMNNQGKISGEPEAMINKALAQDPENAVGLILSGLAAEEQGDFTKAVNNWNRALPKLQDPEQIAHIEQRIAQLGGQAVVDAVPEVQPEGAGASVTVSIVLADEYLDKVKPQDTLFIFARATTGPPMPLAAVRKTVADLPLTVSLDDSMAMMANLKISAFDSVHVSARVSLSGQPTASSGDIEAEGVTAKPGQDEIVELVINQIVP